MRHLLLVGGIIGPVFFTVLVIALSFFQPYNHATQFISELGAVGAPYNDVMNMGLIITGILIIAFAVGLHHTMPSGSMIGPLLIALSGIGMILTAIFPCDAGCFNETFIAELHGWGARLNGFGMIFGLLFITTRIQHNRLRLYTFATTIVSGLFGLTFLLNLYPATLGDVAAVFQTTPAEPLRQLPLGVLQRISTGLIFLWMILISKQLRRE